MDGKQEKVENNNGSSSFDWFLICHSPFKVNEDDSKKKSDNVSFNSFWKQEQILSEFFENLR